jgi:arginase family enzyme
MDGLMDFFQPTSLVLLPSDDGIRRLADGALVHTQTLMPAPDEAQIVIIGVAESRGSDKNKGCKSGADFIRSHFYAMNDIDAPVRIVDMGNIHPGDRIEDTYAALRVVCRDLLRAGKIPVVIGGSQDLTFPCYAAYEDMEQTVNLVTIDSRLDFGGSPDHVGSLNYLNRIVMHQPNYLFNFSNIGHQRYYVDKDVLELMERMYFDVHRLGEINARVSDAEPVLRNADIVSIDMAALRAADSPGSAHAGVNGLYAEHMCQLCRYAGMSDKLTSFGIFEYNPELDPRGYSAELGAQMLWHFIEGVSQRKGDYPVGTKEQYLKYIVALADHELVFYKSPMTNRWWMDVPYPSTGGNRYHRHHLVPCTYEDYQQATNEEMPDRWWKTFQKLT